MEPNADRLQHKLTTPWEPACPSAFSNGAEDCREDLFPASEIMAVALEVTRTSADLYEMVAMVANHMTSSSGSYEGSLCPPQQSQEAHLRWITEEIAGTDRQVRALESMTLTLRSEIFDLFLQDCGAALRTFKEVTFRLAGIIGPNGAPDSSSSGAEVLSQIMKRLETCSEKVTELPETGLAASYQCLAETAFDLQRQAGKLVGEAVRAA